MSFARIRESREHWKTEAVGRRKVIEAKQRHIVRLQRRIEEAKRKLGASRARIAALEADLAARAAAVVPLPPRHAEIRVLCVTMFLIGVIPCNAVSRILDFLAHSGRLALNWIPDPSSVVNWIGRAGLGLLTRVGPMQAPWIAIIDTSISFGKTKALVCLRVPLDHFVRNKRAPGMRDVECIGISIGEIMNGRTVEAALTSFFQKSGAPRAIVKDGGPDIARGVQNYLLTQGNDDDQKTVVIADVGHVAANALKALYKRNGVIERFLALIDKASDRMRQSEIAALRPPKLRTKGRYQSISRVVKWAATMAWLMGMSGTAPAASLNEALRKAIPGLCAFKPFLMRFERDCLILNDFLALLKEKGLNPETGARAKAHLERLPRGNRMRRDLFAWLESHLALHMKMGLGSVPLLVSSDVIETLMGMLKQVIERMPTPEFSTLTLATPLFCGGQTEETIHTALTSCSHQSLKDWRSENCSRTHRKRQRDLLVNQVVECVQETPSAKAA